MEIIKKYKVVLVLALIVIVGVFSFFYRMHNKDVKALTEFLASYEKFDKAISDFAVPVFAANFDLNKTDDLESKASDALIELNTKAAFRLSSLIKNDSVIPPLALEITDFSGKELDNLRAYKKAVQSKNADLDGLAKEYDELTSKRKTAYARFQGLAPQKAKDWERKRITAHRAIFHLIPAPPFFSSVKLCARVPLASIRSGR